MPGDDIETARRHGEEIGEIKAQLAAHAKRLTRIESGILGILIAASALYLKGVGLW